MERSIVEIEKIISNSCGLARHEGKAVFVPDTIPGETVEIEITDNGKGHLDGRVLELIKPSPDRVEPECALYGVCGGCTMQHIAYERQLEIRKELVREALLRNGGIGFGGIVTVPGGPYSYRNRAQFHRLGEGNAGFRKRGGSEIVSVDTCPVCTPAVNDFLSARCFPPLERFNVFSTGSSCYCSGIDEGDNKIPAVFSAEILGHRIETDIDSFFQSNLAMLGKAVELVMGHAEGKRLFDFYSGAGVFASFLAQRAEYIACVESDRKSLSHAENNVKARQGLERAFFGMSAESFAALWKGKSPDSLIADPPRAGISASVKKFIAGLGVKRLLYLSCDYGTLARDLGFLTKNLYRLDHLYLLDFYPQTSHAESLAVLDYTG